MRRRDKYYSYSSVYVSVSFTHSSWYITGITFQTLLKIFTAQHAATFRNGLATFHTCHGYAGIDGARDSPADGSNATLRDATAIKTQQKKKMEQTESVQFPAIFGKKSAYLLLLISCQITRKSIGKAIVSKSQIQICHQWSLVIGVLPLHESARQR